MKFVELHARSAFSLRGSFPSNWLKVAAEQPEWRTPKVIVQRRSRRNAQSVARNGAGDQSSARGIGVMEGGGVSPVLVENRESLQKKICATGSRRICEEKKETRING